VFLLSGEPEALTASVEAASSGALRVSTELPSKLPQTGTLVVLVGRQSELSRERVDGPSDGPGWQRLDWRFRLLY
jgi:hypothetical protein